MKKEKEEVVLRFYRSSLMKKRQMYFLLTPSLLREIELRNRDRTLLISRAAFEVSLELFTKNFAGVRLWNSGNKFHSTH